MVRGAGARKSIGQAYGAMQELQELREQAAELADKNRELAKALAQCLQDGAHASIKTDTFAEKLAQWASEQYGRKQVCERGTQCDLDDDYEPEPPFSPTRRTKKKPRMLSPIIKTYMPEQGLRGSYNSIQRAEDGVGREDDPFDSDFGVGVISAISEENELSSRAKLTPKRLSPQFGEVRRNARTRDDDASYAEARLNVKTRKGSPCGLGKRTRPSNSHHTSGRKHQSSATSQSFIVTIYSPPTPGARPRRVTRRLKRISYAEPKLNTKLRQGDKFTFTT